MSESIMDIGDNFFDGGIIYFVIRSILIFLMSYIIGKCLIKLVRDFEKKDEAKRVTLRFAGKVIHAIIYGIALFAVLSGIKPLSGLGTALLGATSIISVIIGLAAQESFGNFIAGFFLALYRPFNVGDIIYVNDKDILGKVVGITFRHTVIQTFENAKVIIPNSTMNSAIVENRGFGQSSYTKLMKFYVGYDTDIDLMKQLIFDACLSTENVIDIRTDMNKEPFDIRIDDFGENGIYIVFPLTVVSFEMYFVTASEVRKKILKSFKENHIEIPFDKIEVIQKRSL